MRGRRRDRDKASHQEKHDSPVEVEELSSEVSPDGEGSAPALSADEGTQETPTGGSAQPEVASQTGSAGSSAAESEPDPEPDLAPVHEPEPGPVPAPVAAPRPQEAVPVAALHPEEATVVVTEAAPVEVVASDSETATGTESDLAAVAAQDGKPDEEIAQQPTGHLPLPRIIAVANQKGGVGKTTTAVNLGAALAELDFRVLVIDLDPQGNATTGLGIDARNFERSMYDVIMRDDALEDCIEPTNMKNLFVAPATIDLAGAEIELVPAFSRELKLKRAIETVIDDFDYVLIDCPPSLGLITVNGLAAALEVLVPIQCEYYALEGLSQLLRNVHLVASNLNDGLEVSTIVLTMYDARTKLSDQVASEVREHFGAKVCRNVIPRTVRLSEAPSFGQPISVFDPTSRGAIAYRELAKEVSGGAS
jgi:chromosome partitioning protein